MKKVDLNFDIKQLNGDVVDNAGKIIASVLVSETKEDPIKLYDWATKLYKGEEIYVDDSDFIKLRTLINNHPNIFILVKAPIIKYLDNLKEETKK